MNKGIDLVSGQLINFMNSGDRFYNQDVIEEIFINHQYNGVDILFGDHNVIYPNKQKLVKSSNIKKIWKGSHFCHQSCFISSLLHKEHKYNPLNRIGTDFFYKAYKNKSRFEYKDVVISSVSAGGLSDINRIDSIVGWWNVLEKYFQVNFYYLFRIMKEMFKMHIKKSLKHGRKSGKEEQVFACVINFNNESCYFLSLRINIFFGY